MLKCKATATGTQTSFIDVLRLYRGNGSQEGRIGWLASGTAANLAKMVRINGNVKATSTIVFEQTPLPALTAIGDEIELWNERGVGFFPDDVNAEINAALAEVANQVTTPVESVITNFDFDSPYINIPESWRFFGGLAYEDADDIWIPIPATDDFIEIDAINRTVRLKDAARRLADTYRVKLIGDIPSTPLNADSDQTACNAEWLTAYVAYRLLFPRMRRGAGTDDDTATRMAFCKQQEEKTRQQARNRPQGIARRLW